MTEANTKILETLRFGTGRSIEIHEDLSKADNEVGRYFMINIQEAGTVYSVPPHWHKYHDEIFTVLEGRLGVTLEGKQQTVSADDGAFLIPRYHTHSLEGFEGERVVFREETIPGGDYKPLFFSDLLSNDSFPGFWHLTRSFYDGDTYVALPLNVKPLDQVYMYFFGLLSKLFVPPSPKGL